MVKITREKTENCQAFLTVEMEPAETEEAMEASYRQLAKKANIPGFRKGKAPRSVVENYVGKEGILEEALKKLVPQAYEQAIQEQEITPFAQPDIELTQTDPIIFKAVVPLRPSVELGNYQGIRMSPEPVEITDENIDDVMENLRHQHATWDPVDRPLQYGDLSTIDIDSTVGDEPFLKKIGAQYQLVEGYTSPAPGFVEQLLGMNKDEEKEFSLTLPDDYMQPEIAGKEVLFKIKITEIKEEKLPDLDDELAKQVDAKFQNLDDLRKEVVDGLKARGEEKARLEFEEKLLNNVVDQAKVEFPPILEEMEIDRLLEDRSRQLQMSGRALEEYLATINQTPQEMRDELRPNATRNVTASIVLGRVMEEEGIEVDDAVIEAEIDKMTGGVDESKKEELRKMLDTPETRRSIRQSLLTQKTIERLKEIAGGSDNSKTENNETEEKEAK